MTQPFREPAPVSQQTFEQLLIADPESSEVRDFFRQHPNEPALDEWLLSQLDPPTAHSQGLLRLARQAQSYWEGTDGFQHLLIGIPLSVEAAAGQLDWAPLRREFEGTLASTLLPLIASVSLCGRPAPVDDLHQVGPSHLGTWSESLYTGRDPAQHFEPPRSGASVWVGQISVLKQDRAELEALLFKITPELSRRMLKVAPRLEALAEEQGAKLRVFPPTAYWNSLSFARLFHARAAVTRFKKLSGPWLVRRDGSRLVLSTGGKAALSLDMTEELPVDYEPIFKDWAELI